MDKLKRTEFYYRLTGCRFSFYNKNLKIFIFSKMYLLA
jgi:hypothetical protein